MTVRATDNGGLYDSISVTISITNVTEAAALTGLSAGTLTRTTATATVTLSNGDGASTTVYLRYRTPPGSGSWSSVISEVTSGTSVSFDLTALTEGSQYRAQASLDSSFPSAGRRQVDFTTTSNTGPAFASSTVTLEVQENTLAGTDVGDPVSATDGDGDTLTYTMSGTDAAAFDIDSATGQISVGSTTSLDYETAPSYMVTVTATDPHGGSAQAMVTIEVQDLREAGVLGRIVITLGGSGSDYGYDSGSYGTLDSGDFPGALFDDGNDRTVAEIYEDGSGYWYFTYSGGLADDWLSDEAALSEITVEVTYEDGRDMRSFVLGGFVNDRPGSRGLKLDPPLPSRDWESRTTEEVAFEFYRHVGQAVAPVIPAALTEPVAVTGSFVEFLIDTTPGGGVVFQSLVTIFVYSGYLFSVYKRRSRPQPFEVLLAGMVLCLTPWVPVIWGIGDPIAGVILLGNLALGAYAYKAYFARTET